MSITDELRKWAEDNTLRDRVLTTCPPQHVIHGVLETLLRIADRIDAEHESACAEAYGNGVMSVPIAIDESQWVKLPVDADGEPIRIGDVMEWPDGSTAEVVGIGPDTFFYVEDGEDAAEWSCASDKIHHHAPTVEDVLREFAQEMNENLGMYTGEAIDADEWRDADAKTVEKFAVKLRLANDGEEL